MISCNSFSKTAGNKEIKVMLEFPEQSDQKAEQEFFSRLKEICLQKAGVGTDE